MENNTRKATDVLISLEAKIDLLLNYYRSQDLNIKILSNKLNLLSEQLAKSPPANDAPKIKIEAADFVIPVAKNNQTKDVHVSSDFNITVESAPDGNRRTSREIDEHDMMNHPLNKASNKLISKKEPLETINYPQVKEEKFVPPKLEGVDSVQLVQRVINKNNGSVFLAEVEIKSNKDGNIVHKTRTNGVGKWFGTLPPGEYKVTIKKKNASGRENIEISQNINVDGSKSLVELSDICIK